MFNFSCLNEEGKIFLDSIHPRDDHGFSHLCASADVNPSPGIPFLLFHPALHPPKNDPDFKKSAQAVTYAVPRVNPLLL